MKFWNNCNGMTSIKFKHATQNVKTHTMTAHTKKQKQKQTIKEQKTRTSQKTRG
jgi:hypothetical protein